MNKTVRGFAFYNAELNEYIPLSVVFAAYKAIKADLETIDEDLSFADFVKALVDDEAFGVTIFRA